MIPQPEGLPRRIGEGDRDAGVRRLQEAYAEGHLSHEEMDAGLHRALTATTHGELVAALRVLPAEPADTTSTIGAVSGRIQRRGVWRVPRFLKVESALGRVRLDLSRAVIEHAVVDIELHVGTGSARITVPRDATVEFEALRAGWKDTRYRPRRRSGAGGPTIRISGAMGMGRLKIRHARR
ncbi:DUF1707 domain-containing protein [Kitasatospora sp. NPDC091207]|uniref:DUF1707 SHOCT-like domain-containing protein n=1 Tax=Kitasatospora sp. NPDC091207 TaxID=3364083 RepID=UPI0037F7EE29